MTRGLSRVAAAVAVAIAIAIPGTLPAQSFSVGAGGAVLTTSRILQGEAAGGVVGVIGQAEAAFGHAGLRADVTVFDGVVLTTLGGAWHILGSGRTIDPFAFGAGVLQLPTFDWGDGTGAGLAGGAGIGVRPRGSRVVATVELRLLHLFRNAYEFDPRNLLQLSAGLRLMLR